jgi:large subunit ribosomal protein L22
MKAHLRKARISLKKANLVAGMVRGKKVTEALAILKFMPKKGADLLYKVVLSAASNAKNNFKQSIDDLIITRILVTKGATYRRSIPISRGRVHPIGKRTAHITVEVGYPEGFEPKTPVKAEKAPKKAAAKATKKTEEVQEVKKTASKKEKAVKEVKKAAPKKTTTTKKITKKETK